jgi:hypothetical protein
MSIIAEDIASWGMSRGVFQAQAQERRELLKAKLALSHLQGGLKMWIVRGVANPERMLREMQQTLDKVEEILNG